MENAPILGQRTIESVLLSCKNTNLFIVLPHHYNYTVIGFRCVANLSFFELSSKNTMSVSRQMYKVKNIPAKKICKIFK